MNFPYPRILERVMSSDWAITNTALESIISTLDNIDARGIEARMPSKQMETSMVSIVGNTGVINASGIIGKSLSSLEMMCGGLDVNALVSSAESLANDPSVNKIVMNWNSPGGTVTGVPEAYDALVAVGRKKMLISYTETMMASAAQWLASAAVSTYAAKSATVGSIGVYNLILDRTVELAQAGVRVDAIQAGKYKLLGAPFKALSSEERAMLQERVDAIHKDFKAAVTRNRNVDAAAMEGQGLTGSQGLKAGIVDAIYPSLSSLLSRLG